MTIRDTLAELVTADAPWLDTMSASLERDGLTDDDLHWLARRAGDVGARHPRGMLHLWLESGDWRAELRHRPMSVQPGDEPVLPQDMLDDPAKRAAYFVAYEGYTLADAAHAIGVPADEVRAAMLRVSPDKQELPCGHWAVVDEGRKPKCWQCADAARGRTR